MDTTVECVLDLVNSHHIHYAQSQWTALE